MKPNLDNPATTNTASLEYAELAAKPKRHIAVAVRHLVAQRAKALLIKANAQAEIEQLEEALDSLGWTDK